MAQQEEKVDYSSDEERGGRGGRKRGRAQAKTAGDAKDGAPTTQIGQAVTQASTFKDFLLREELMRAINEAGFEKPSEVQQKGIYFILYGVDLLCQAKSGTGKTAVFVLGILQNTKVGPEPFQTLVLCNTRELAFQIAKEFERLGKYIQGLKVATIYGGVEVDDQALLLENNPPHILIGTPGRVLQLVKRDLIKLDTLRYFVIDECDEVLRQFDMRQDVQEIFVRTRPKKQVLMFSATLSDKNKEICLKFLKKSHEIIQIDEQRKLTLVGLKQFHVALTEEEKIHSLVSLLYDVRSNQAIIFTRKVERAKHLHRVLEKLNLPTLTVHRDMPQERRIEQYQQFKEGKKRIMVTTNLLARGIDVDKVNLVINFDAPESSDDYLHRVGRAGRFNTKGVAITFVTTEEDKKILEEIQARFEVKIEALPQTLEEKKAL